MYWLAAFVAFGILSLFASDPLPSWNEGEAKVAILHFIQETCDPQSPNFVAKEDRIAVFDQDGTLWIEHPMYTQVIYSMDQIRNSSKLLLPRFSLPVQAKIHQHPFEFSAYSLRDLTQIALVGFSGMPVDEFLSNVRAFLDTAIHPRFQRRYTELIYQPMLEVLQLFQKNGYLTYIVTGGQQDFVRAYSQAVYNIPPEQVCGSMLDVQYGYNAQNKPILIETPKLLFSDNFSGKPAGIHFMIGKKPFAAFGNSIGDRQMLEYTASGDRLRLMMLVLHNDPIREYAYGPAEKLPNTRIGRFTQDLYHQAKESNWTIIRMKEDWKQIFPTP